MYKLSPSKAHRYLQCTQSLKFDTEFVETPASIRGSMLHTFAEKILKEEETNEFENENNISSYERFLITSYVNAVWSEYNRIQANKISVENKEAIRIYDIDINLIIDTVVLSEDTASIIDLKTGNGDVSAEENEQLLFYAYDIAIKYPKINKFRLSIFQKGKLKTVEKERADVFDFFIEKADVFEQIKNDELTFNPSEKACKFCAYKQECKARAEWIIGGKK